MREKIRVDWFLIDGQEAYDAKWCTIGYRLDSTIFCDMTFLRNFVSTINQEQKKIK